MLKSLEDLKGSLQKEFGDNSVMFASEIPPYKVFRSGSLGLDYATGIGGFPSNRVIEIGGSEGVGKTTLTLHALNNRLKAENEWGTNRDALYIDIENRMTGDWLNNFVEEPDRVIIVKPDSMEQATDIYYEAVKSGQIGIVVLDSVGAAPTQRVLDKSATIGNFGGNSLAVSRFANLATTMSGKYDVTTICINQVRDDMQGFNRYITPGGRALKHACSLRIELKVRKQAGDKAFIEGPDGKEQVGSVVVAKIHKNSVGAPNKSVWWWFYNIPTEEYGFGIDQFGEVARLAITTEVVKKISSQMYEHPSFGQLRGRNAVLERIRQDPEVFDAIVGDVMDALSSGAVSGVAESFDDSELLGSEPFAGLDASEFSRED